MKIPCERRFNELSIDEEGGSYPFVVSWRQASGETECKVGCIVCT